MSEQLPSVPGVYFKLYGTTVYAYHRKTQQRITAAYGTPEFEAQLNELNTITRPADRPRTGTLLGLIDDYRASPEFTLLMPRTRKDYERVFTFIRPEASKKLLVNFRTKDILAIRNQAEKKHKRSFANYCVTVLKLLMTWGVTNEYLPHHPVAPGARLKIRRPHGTPKANRRWAPFECEAVLEAAKGGIKVAIALGMYAGMREGDALAATQLNYLGTHIMWTQRKTGEPLRLKADPRLRAILDEALANRSADDASHLALNRQGQHYTMDGFRTMLWKLNDQLKRDGKVQPGLTFHGLRHTAASTLADLGAGSREIAAMLGHKTLAMAELYSREAEQHKLRERAIDRLRKADEAHSRRQMRKPAAARSRQKATEFFAAKGLLSP